jgi:peptidoglycan/LPS O-acetylase OafA/YrhL
VDVFLVLSAYFLTRKLLGYFGRPGSRSDRRAPGPWLRDHYIRVANRLIPSSVIVLVAVLVATYLWAPVAQHIQNIHEVLASALYYENWELIWSQLAYGAAGPDSSPLQHYWSLAVQGQFFLIWPLLALAIYAVLGRGRRTFPSVFFVVTTILTIASFVWAIILVGADQQVAYFSTYARFWELGAGALIAFLPVSFCSHRLVREGAVWTGLAMIVASGFLFDGAVLFPGFAALWPVVASLLVIFGASRDVPSGLSSRLLSQPPITFLARIAYQLYLWHWPILIFYLQIQGYERAGWKGALIILALSFALAIVTERATTTVTDRALHRWNWRGALLVPAVSLCVLTAMTLTWSSAAETQRAEALAAAARLSPDHIGAMALSDPEKAASLSTDAEILPSPETAYEDRASIYGVGCVQKVTDEPSAAEVLVCDVDDYGARKTVVMTGGSYVAQWYPALRTVAEQEGWRLLVIEKNGCRLTTDSSQSSCAAWNEEAVSVISSYHPDVVFTLGTAVNPLQSTPESIPQGNLNQVQKLADEGIPVIGVRGTPKFLFPVPPCLIEHDGDASACSTRRVDTFVPDVFEAAAADLPSNLTFIDLTDAICEPEICEPVVGNVLAYRDAGHLTSTFAGTLAPALSNAMREAMPELF